MVHMHQGLVAHEQCAHGLQSGDFQGEVEGGDEPHGAEGPPVAVALLPGMVPGHSKRAGMPPHLPHATCARWSSGMHHIAGSMSPGGKAENAKARCLL